MTSVGSESLYERYKDALKRGHVASLRGQADEALLAYAEAAAIAPERPTPHSSAGTALLRRGRPAEALRHYDVALSIAPRDEAGLLGRAQALAALDRRGEAADVFDALAEVQAANGRLADAVDAARRGLELAEGRERRRTLKRLIARLRESEPDEPGRAALERALRVLDGPAAPLAGESPEAPAPPEADEGTGSDLGASPVGAPAPRAPREIPAGATVPALTARAETAVAAGEPGPVVEALLDLAALHARDGHVEAALDACYTAVSFDPDSVDLHLSLAALYTERGWDALATAKLDLLERLARLDGDERTLADIGGARPVHR